MSDDKTNNIEIAQSEDSAPRNQVKITDDPDETIMNLTAAVKAQKKEDNINSANANYQEGVTLYQSGKFDESLPHFEKTAQIYSELVKEDDNPDFLTKLAKTYIFLGSVLWSLKRLDEVIGEIDKAIEVYEDLINKHNRTDFVNSLATAYMNKGVGLNTLDRCDEAIIEYDKAAAIYEKSIEQDANPALINELAKILLNKGVALKQSGKLAGAIDEYSKSIAIFEDLVNRQGRADLAAQLAAVYMNKGSALEVIDDLPEALKMFSAAIEIWEKDLREGYSNVVPDLIKALRIRTIIAVKLEDWQQTAMDTIFAMLLFETYLKKENYSEHYKKNISGEFYVILFQIKELTEENREKVFALTDKIGREAYEQAVEFSSILRQRIELL